MPGYLLPRSGLRYARLTKGQRQSYSGWGQGNGMLLYGRRKCRPTLLLMDDLEGREEVVHHTFSVMGTLRVLELATERGLLDLPAAIAKLQTTSFYALAALIQEMLARDTARQEQS